MFFGALNLKVPSEENVTFRFSLRRLSKDGYLTSENLDLFISPLQMFESKHALNFSML